MELQLHVFVMQVNLSMVTRAATTGIALFAVRRRRTAKRVKRTVPPLPCAFCPSARQRAPDAFLPGKELCRALWEKTTHGTVLCHA
jgi:hypothetical protein